MHDSNRGEQLDNRRLVAFSAVAFLACLGAWIVYSYIHNAERENAASSQQNDSIVECVSSLGFGRLAECSLQAAQSPYEKTKDWYDLKAQQDMAKWALLMLIVTSLGVVHVALTLSETKKANVGFKISGERQDRAYIAVQQFSFLQSGANKPPGAIIRFVNVGKTPANKVYVWYRIDLRPMDSLEPRPSNYSEIERLKCDKSLGPETGGTSTAMLPQTLTQEQYVAMVNEELAIVMWGEVHYVDIFNRSQVTNFCFFYKGNPNLAGQPMSAWREGNAAT